MDSLQVVEYVMSEDIFLFQTMFVIAFLVLTFKFIYEVTRIADFMKGWDGLVKQILAERKAVQEERQRIAEKFAKRYQKSEQKGGGEPQ